MQFLYEDYRNIIKKLFENGYTPIGYNEANTYGKEVILRHDVDVSPEKALELAKREKEWGVKSTYYFLITSRLYNVLDKKNREIIEEISKLGHYIGLHFDETNYDLGNNAEDRNEKIKALIVKEKKVLEDSLENVEIGSVSMHIPSKETLEANLHFENGFVNSYGYDFFKGYKYVSDSEMRWRENVWEVIECGEYNKLHVLTHPIWFDDNVLEKKEKVQNYLSKKKLDVFDEIKIIVPRIENEIDIK